VGIELIRHANPFESFFEHSTKCPDISETVSKAVSESVSTMDTGLEIWAIAAVNVHERGPSESYNQC